jgi:hypothetical protein
MPDELTQEAKDEIAAAIAIVRADRFELHARGILDKYKPPDPPKGDPPKDPPTGDPPPPKPDEPAPKRKPLWVTGSTDEPEPPKPDPAA